MYKRELEKVSDEWEENDVTDSFISMKGGKESMNRDYKQVADGPPPNNTHLIRQKKDFSCTQSDGDDSETGKQNVWIQKLRDPARREPTEAWLQLALNEPHQKSGHHW